MAKPKIIISSEEEDESNTNFSDEESPLETDLNDNEDIDAYDEEEDYQPQRNKSRSAAQSRQRKAVSRSEDILGEEEEDLDKELASLSNDEEEEEDMDANFENEPSDMDDDLEPKDDNEYGERDVPLKRGTTQGKGKKSIKIKIKPPTRKDGKAVSDIPSTTLGSSRNTRKIQMNYYQDDGDDFSEDLSEIETPPKGTKRVKVKAVPVRKPQHPDLDPELLLTDEEEEYIPSSVNDVSKMTERQRARLNTDVSGAIEDPYFELDASGKKPKHKKVKEETEEEIALRKAENARKRQDYKNKILEEEKRDTLNKLLKRRATKSRETIAEDKEGSVGIDEDSKSYYKERRATLNHPALIRYVNNTTSLSGNSVLAYK